MTGRRVAAGAGALTLGGLAVLHAAWAAGSSWPVDDRTRLAQLAAGTDHFPSRGRCAGVAALLATAAALVAGAGGRAPIARLGRAGVSGVLIGRGVAGLTGNTHRLVGWSTSAEFDRLDRRYYGPLCCTLGLLAAAGLAPADQTPTS